jgi:hypothetical protein
LPNLNPSNAKTSRLDGPSEYPKRHPTSLPRERRVVEIRPQSLKLAETSQIEPGGTSGVSIRKPTSLEGAIIKVKDKVSVRIPAPESVTESAVPTDAVSPETNADERKIGVPKKPWASWVWFLIGAVTASAITAVTMHFLGK